MPEGARLLSLPRPLAFGQYSDTTSLLDGCTCTVTEHSDKKCRNIIRKLHRLRPSADIVVTGCYAQMKKEEISRIEGVSRVFGAEEKSMVVPSVMAGLAEAGNLEAHISHAPSSR